MSFFSRTRQNYGRVLKLNVAEKMKWHTSMDLLAHACVPNVDIGHLLSSICFLHPYQEMTEISECNSISLECCHGVPIPHISAKHQ